MPSTHRTNLPDVNIPDKDKDEDYHKDFVLSIINDSFSGSYEFMYRAMQENYDYYDGTQSDDAWKFVQETEGGDTLPARWINFNKIKTKVDVLLGELAGKGFNIKVRAQNKEAKSARLSKKQEILSMMRVQDDIKEIEAIAGVPLMPDVDLPKDEDELDYFMKNTYKDMSEEVMEAALRYIIRQYNWRYERIALFRDVLIAGRCFCKVETVDGVVKWDRVDPRYMVFDNKSKDDFLTDSTHFGEIHYRPLAEVRQRHKLSKMEVDQIKRSSNGTDKLKGFQASKENMFGSSDTDLKFIDGEGDDMKVLEFHGYWMDNKRMNYIEIEDKFGNLHFKEINDKEAKSASKKGKGKVVSKQIKIWRKCTILGGAVVRDWGVMENMIRSVDNIANTLPPFVSLIPNYMNFQGVSKVEQLRGLQDLKNVTMYNIQLRMATAGPKGFIYDVAQCPDEYTPEEVIKVLKTTGITFINSNKDGIPTNTNAFSEFDMSLSNSISGYIEISMMVDREMSEISGINEARQGTTQSSSTAVGVNTAQLMQSAMSTETYFEFFRMFSEKVMNQMAGLIKTTWTDMDKWGPIIGDTGVMFINEDMDLALNDYGVFVDIMPAIMEDQREFKKTLDIALQQGAIRLDDYLDLSIETNIHDAIKRFKKRMTEREAEAQQGQIAASQQQGQQAQQSQAVAQQQKTQDKMNEESLKGSRQKEIENQRSQNRKDQMLFQAQLERMQPTQSNQ